MGSFVGVPCVWPARNRSDTAIISSRKIRRSELFHRSDSIVEAANPASRLSPLLQKPHQTGHNG
jgi:hypothetical protein